MVTAIYCRVSSNKQETKSQEVDLATWAKAEEAKGTEIQWYREKASGTNYKRSKVWETLSKDMATGKVNRLVVWRMDRLGRLAGETIVLLDDLERRGIGFLSIRDGFDPATPAGRLTRNVLASVAQFETEVRKERQTAGIQAAKAEGKKWGGRKVGTRVKVTEEVEKTIRDMNNSGKSKSEMSRVLNLTRQTIDRVLGQWQRTVRNTQPEPESPEFG